MENVSIYSYFFTMKIKGLRWQKWAVYERLMTKNNFQYSIEDYIFQNLLKDLDKRDSVQSKKSIWGILEKSFRERMPWLINSFSRCNG